MKTLISFSLAFIFSTALFSQQYFVEFIVDDVDSYEKAKKVEVDLSSNSDYQMVRMDFHTGRCFIIMSPNTIFEEPHFKSALIKIGYKISCFYLGERGKDPFLDIKRGHCN